MAFCQPCFFAFTPTATQNPCTCCTTYPHHHPKPIPDPNLLPYPYHTHHYTHTHHPTAVVYSPLPITILPSHQPLPTHLSYLQSQTPTSTPYPSETNQQTPLQTTQHSADPTTAPYTTEPRPRDSLHQLRPVEPPDLSPHPATSNSPIYPNQPGRM